MVSEKEEFKATLTKKGQVVIGSRIRKKLGLEPQQKFSEKVEEDKIVLKPIETPRQLKGSLKDVAEGKTTDGLMKEVKEGWK